MLWKKLAYQQRMVITLKEFKLRIAIFKKITQGKINKNFYFLFLYLFYYVFNNQTLIIRLFCPAKFKQSKLNLQLKLKEFYFETVRIRYLSISIIYNFFHDWM